MGPSVMLRMYEEIVWRLQISHCIVITMSNDDRNVLPGREAAAQAGEYSPYRPRLGETDSEKLACRLRNDHTNAQEFHGKQTRRRCQMPSPPRTSLPCQFRVSAFEEKSTAFQSLILHRIGAMSEV
ncbi:hypothetical protein AcW2_006820 [Taiwanofungus camphoratus]|nr:hypothetical protein AcW2_006820 [Antrodia cinnamomea]